MMFHNFFSLLYLLIQGCRTVFTFTFLIFFHPNFNFLKVENSSGAVNEMANTMMQKFWDSALALEPPDDYDTQRYYSFCLTYGPNLLYSGTNPAECSFQ